MKKIFLSFLSAFLLILSQNVVAQMPQAAPQSMSAADFESYMKELSTIVAHGTDFLGEMSEQELKDYATHLESRRDYWEAFVKALKAKKITDNGAKRKALGIEAFNKEHARDLEEMLINLNANRPFAEYTENQRNFLASELDYMNQTVLARSAAMARISLQKRFPAK